MAEIESWFTKVGDFPKTFGSEDLIAQLGRGKIGTDDDKVIDGKILPAENPTLQIRIGWPDGSDPKSNILWRVMREKASSKQVRQHISVSR